MPCVGSTEVSPELRELRVLQGTAHASEESERAALVALLLGDVYNSINKLVIAVTLHSRYRVLPLLPPRMQIKDFLFPFTGFRCTISGNNRVAYLAYRLTSF